MSCTGNHSFKVISMNYNHKIQLIEGVFINWILQSAHDGKINIHLIFFSDEAQFHLHREVNSQNRKWGSHNPKQMYETSLHVSKIGVWCSVI